MKLLLVLLTITVIIFAWITHQLDRPVIQAIILALIMLSVVAFFVMNILEERENRARRRARESMKKEKESPVRESTRQARDNKKGKRSDTSFSLSERKSGLSWGGGNILASDATRGTRRKFLRKQR